MTFIFFEFLSPCDAKVERRAMRTLRGAYLTIHTLNCVAINSRLRAGRL